MRTPSSVMSSPQLCDMGLGYPSHPERNLRAQLPESNSAIQMENLFFLLESVYAAWLGPRATAWATDMTLAVVCGLGLYLLIHPYLERYLLSPSTNNISETQIQILVQRRCRKKIETAFSKGLSTHGVHKTKPKVKEKDGSLLQEVSPGHHLNSSGNMLKSISAKQDTTLPSFWDMRENQDQQMATKKLSYPSILDDQFQQKYSQLFWGLPSLHSESLVAAAWIPQGSSTLPSPFFFNVISNVYSVPKQHELSPVLSQAHHLSYLELRSSTLILSSPQFQHLPLNQAQSHEVSLQSSLPAQLSASLPYTKDTGTLSSEASSKTQGLPTEIQHQEKQFSKKQLESELALPWMVQRPQEVYDVLPPNLSQDLAVSVLPENFPISPELREKLEEHIQKWLIQHQWNFAPRMQGSQLQKKLTDTCLSRNMQGRAQSLVSRNEINQDVQKMGFPLEKESVKNLGPILGKIPKDPSMNWEKTPSRALGINIAGSVRNQEKHLMRDLINDTVKYKTAENTLKAHLGTKSEQINQGLIPLSVRRSWLAMSSGFCTSDTHMETRNIPSSRNSEKLMSSSQKLAFLSPATQQALDAHVVRLWVKHMWGLPLKVLKPVNAFKSLPIALCSQSSTTRSLSGATSAVEVVRFPGIPSQVCLREIMIPESYTSLGSLFLLSPPSFKEIERSLLETPTGTEHKPSKAPPTRESRQSDTLVHGAMVTPSQMKAAIETPKGNQEVPLLPGPGDQDPGAPSLQASVVSEFPHRVEKESGGQPQVSATAVLLSDYSKSKLHTTDTLASQMVGEIVVQHRNNSPGQQKLTIPNHQISQNGQIQLLVPTYVGENSKRPSTPKHQNSQKGQSQVLAPIYQDENRKRQSKGEHEQPKFIQVREKEDTFKNKYQPPPKTTQVPPTGLFQSLLSRFLKWFPPKKAIKGEEKPMKKGKPTPATPKSRRQAKKKPRVDSNVAEAQKLMTAVGQMLEKKMMLQQKLCATQANQHRAAPPAFVSHISYGHRPPTYYSQQRTAQDFSANSSCQRCSTLDKQVEDQQPLKNRLNSEGQAPKNSNHMSSRALNLVYHYQNDIVPMSSISSKHHYCPRHCVFQRSLDSNEGEHSSLVFSSRKSPLKEM